MGTESDMRELKVQAGLENLSRVLAFVDGILEEMDCPMRTQLTIDVAVEEIFVNIASYAYEGREEAGEALILVRPSGKEPGVEITFVDSGMPYDPLAKEDPDVTLPAEKRQIGGLGIYMVKKSMDAVYYEHRDGCNRLTLVKYL